MLLPCQNYLKLTTKTEPLPK